MTLAATRGIQRGWFPHWQLRGCSWSHRSALLPKGGGSISEPPTRLSQHLRPLASWGWSTVGNTRGVAGGPPGESPSPGGTRADTAWTGCSCAGLRPGWASAGATREPPDMGGRCLGPWLRGRGPPHRSSAVRMATGLIPLAPAARAPPAPARQAPCTCCTNPLHLPHEHTCRASPLAPAEPTPCTCPASPLTAAVRTPCTCCVSLLYLPRPGMPGEGASPHLPQPASPSSRAVGLPVLGARAQTPPPPIPPTAHAELTPCVRAAPQGGGAAVGLRKNESVNLLFYPQERSLRFSGYREEVNLCFPGNFFCLNESRTAWLAHPEPAGRVPGTGSCGCSRGPGEGRSRADASYGHQESG